MMVMISVSFTACEREASQAYDESHEIWIFGTNVENVSDTAFIVKKRTHNDSVVDVEIDLKCDGEAYHYHHIERIAQEYYWMLHQSTVDAHPLQQDSGEVHTSSDTLFAVILSDDKVRGLFIISKDYGTFAFRNTTEDLVVVKSETQMLSKDGSIDSIRMIPYAYLMTSHKSLR